MIAKRGIMKKIIGIAMLVILSGCYENPPKPDTSTLPVSLETPTSAIQMNVKLNTNAIAEAVNTQVPMSLLSVVDYDVENHSSGSSSRHIWMSANVNREAPFELKVENNQLVLTTRIGVGGTAHYKKCTNINLVIGSKWICGTASGNFAAIANVKAKIDLTITPEWKLASNSTNMSVEVITANINLYGLPISMGNILQTKLNEKLANYIPQIDSEIRKISVKEKMEELWNKANFQKELVNNDVWIRFQPMKVALSKTTENENMLVLHPRITGQSEIYTSLSSIPAANPTALPNLEESNPTDDVFSIHLPVKLDYKKIAEHAMGAIGENPIEDGKNAKIFVKGIEIYPHNEKIVVAIKFKADVKGSLLDAEGSIYLYGTPKYDAKNDQFLVENLDFTLETKNALVKAGDWVAHDLFKKKLSNALVYDMSEAKKYRDLVNNKLKSISLNEQIQINGELDKLDLSSIYLTKSDAVAVFAMTGKLGMTYNPKQ